VTSGLILHLDSTVTASYPGTGSFWRDISGAGIASMGNADLSTGNFTFESLTRTMFANSGAASGGISVSLSNFSKQEGTAEFWVMPLVYTGSNGLFVNNNVSTPDPLDWIWMGFYNSGQYSFFRIGDGTNCCAQDISHPAAPPPGSWVQAVYTWSLSGKTIKSARNGAVFATRSVTAIPATNPSTTGRIGLGYLNTQAEFRGYISVVRFYNRALSDAEIQQNFNAQRARFGL